MGVDILILGAGWTSTFLLPLCTACSLTHASTTRSGRPGTLKFVFDPDSSSDESESEDIEPYKILPDAHTVLITFPIHKKPGAAERLVRLYRWSRREDSAAGREFETGFILLGTTGIWDSARGKLTTLETKWYDRHTPPTAAPNPRANAEIELLALSAPQTPTTVLNLAGLWGYSSSGGDDDDGDGGGRHPRNWVGRVAPTKEALRGKGSLHLLHGHDLARAILAVHSQFPKAAGQRWILTDGRVYDWWDIAGAWGVAWDSEVVSKVPKDKTQVSEAKRENEKARAGNEGGDGENEKKKKKQKEEPGEGNPTPHAQWVRELMREQDVRALPRPVGALGRALDSREFWEEFGLSPARTLMVSGG